MDGCSLFSLIACFSWSNLYLDAHVDMLDMPTYSYSWEIVDTKYPWGVERVWQPNEVRKYANPYGGYGIGFEIPMRNASISLEVSHMLSSMDSGKDKGINAVSLRFRWHPFSR